jgi:hypothetical protein
VEAIHYETDLPEIVKHYQQINADFFAEIGSPGGARRVGKISADPLVVKNLELRSGAGGL